MSATQNIIPIEKESHEGRTNYIFLDYENIHTAQLQRVAGKPVQVCMVLGPRLTALPVELVTLIHQHAGQVSLVRARKHGKNAADFVLAYEVGRTARRDPDGYFHILSKDTGFDTLIGHLSDQDILASRHNAWGDIRILMDLDERVQWLGDHFRSAATPLPQRQSSLKSYVQERFYKTLSESEVNATVQRLIEVESISISEQGRVTYSG